MEESVREYEFTVIASTQIGDDERKKLFEKYENLLLADGGEVIVKKDWGTKKLAFPINRQFRGHFVNYDLTARKEHLAEVERLMRIDENILRYLSIKLGENVDVDARKKELAKKEAEYANSKQQIKE